MTFPKDSIEKQTPIPGDEKNEAFEPEPRITFDPSTNIHPRRDATLYIPGPRDRDQGNTIIHNGLHRQKLTQNQDNRLSSSGTAV